MPSIVSQNSFDGFDCYFRNNHGKLNYYLEKINKTDNCYLRITYFLEMINITTNNILNNPIYKHISTRQRFINTLKEQMESPYLSFVQILYLLDIIKNLEAETR